MTIGGTLPKHLEVAARTGVLGSPARDDMPYRQVAMEVDLTAKKTTLVDLGGMPVPTRNAKQVDTLIEKSKSVEPVDWYLTLHISQNNIDDDQTGTLERNFRDLMPAFQRHINSQVFTYLDAGDATTYGLGVDGLTLFNDSHVYIGAAYQTVQDNAYALALSLTNFNTVWVAASQFRDDQGNYYRYVFDLLVCNPANNVIASNITGNPQDYSTGDRKNNPYSGRVNYITAPEIGSAAWMLIASNEPTKPLFVAIRKRPALNDMWFDRQAGDGGVWYFQYHGRYTVDYGDPLLAIMGQT
jgi:phage major head subunit gpT-like protein